MTSSKRKNKSYTQQFKEETVALVTEQGYTVMETADAVFLRPNQIYNWKQHIADESNGARLTGEDREELLRRRKEVKELQVDKEILKKASTYFAKEMK
ncbi:MAG: transposase [Arenicella sp.]|jgi:transposase